MYLPVEKATSKAGRTSKAQAQGLKHAFLQAWHSTGLPLIELGHFFQAVEELLEELIFELKSREEELARQKLRE